MAEDWTKATRDWTRYRIVLQARRDGKTLQETGYMVGVTRGRVLKMLKQHGL
jgi:hypothetical protein